MATGGRAPELGPERISIRRWATIGLICAALGLAVLFFTPGRLGTVAGAVLVLAGALTFVAGVIAAVIRTEIRRAGRLVAETMGSSALSMLPPARALETLLGPIYGASGLTQDVVTALLGGEGLALDGGDSTVSEHTEIDFRLSRVDDLTYRFVMEQRYSFRTRVPTSRFVIFATSDHGLRDSIIAGCRLPLFEMWFVRDDPVGFSFQERVEDMCDSVRIGMQYRDQFDRPHEVAPRDPAPQMREVMLGDWGRYLAFFRTDLPGEVAVDRLQFMGKLRIFEIDLLGLAEPGAGIDTIQQLTVRSTTLQLLADGFCYWQAPYPCFVERMSFDTTTLDSGSDADLVFHLKPFTLRADSFATTWTSMNEPADVSMRAWLLPGHGMALMWRPATHPPIALGATQTRVRRAE